MYNFLKKYCAGKDGRGLAIGGPLSPILFNLYCEAFLDWKMRFLCQDSEGKMQYSRYADDLTFSRDIMMSYLVRQKIRKILGEIGMKVNHRKSKVLKRSMGVVHITKVGIREVFPNLRQGVITFPKNKRKKLHGMIMSYLKGHDNRETARRQEQRFDCVVSGYVAEFLHYFKQCGNPTKQDKKTFALCKAFRIQLDRYKYDAL
jgi:hypothetical protein